PPTFRSPSWPLASVPRLAPQRIQRPRPSRGERRRPSAPEVAMRQCASIISLGLVAVASSVAAQSPMPHAGAIAPIHTTMKDLHAHGGVPRGWKFLLPPGDPAAGRQVFASMKCFECHEIKGEAFPPGDRKPGPELTGMGAHHPVEYFAESILNPNRVVVDGAG